LNLEHIGLTHVYRGDFAQAVTSVHEAWAADPDWVGAWPNASLAYTYLHSGRYEDVRAVLKDELAAKWHPMSHVPVRLLAWTNLAGGKYTEAMALAQRGVDLCHTAQAWQNRNEWRAWAQAPLGLALHYLGREAEAKRELYEALQTCVEIRAFLPLMHLMPVIPVVLASEECDTLKVRAVELYALAESLPFVANSRLFADIAGQHIAATTATLPADVTVAAQKRGKTRDWWDTAETLLKELAELGWAPKPTAE
jgi:tetratricopeptide (TPR) repeat protein